MIDCERLEYITKTRVLYEGSERTTELHHRREPLFGLYWSILSPERAQRAGIPKPGTLEESKHEKCYFELKNIHQTPEPRFYHETIRVNEYVPVTVPNLFTYSLCGTVNCFTSHDKYNPMLLDAPDFYNYLHITQHNARLLTQSGHTRMFSHINVGPLAGGTQQHPHSQDGVLEEHILTTNDQELSVYSTLAQKDRDPFVMHEDFVREHQLLGYENKDAYAAGAYAPQYPDQIDIYPKERISKMTDLDPGSMRSLSEVMAQSVLFLTQTRGVTQFNMIAHSDRLNSNERGYRLHFHLYPRNKNVFGGLEVGHNVYVVDVFGETTAKLLRAFSKH